MPYVLPDASGSGAGAGGWLAIGGSLLSGIAGILGAGQQSYQGALYAYQGQIAQIQAQLALQQAGMYEWIGQAQAAASNYNSQLALRDAEASKKIALFNASVLENEALAAEQSAGYKAYLLDRAGSRLLSTQTARFAASGVNPGTGSPQEVLMGTEDDLALEIALARYEGDVDAARLRNQAKITIWGGEVTAQKAEAQSIIDQRLAEQYIIAGQAQASASRISSQIFDLESAATGVRAQAASAVQAASYVQVGASLLSGIGRASMHWR